MDSAGVLSILPFERSFVFSLALADERRAGCTVYASAPLIPEFVHALENQFREVNRFLARLAALRQSRSRTTPQASSNPLRDLGRLIYTQLVPKTIQDALRTLPAGSLLTIVSSNHAIPWELAHDGEDFLACKYAVARQEAAPRLPRVNSAKRELRWAALLIGNPTGDLPEAHAEIEHLDRLISAVPGCAHPRILLASRATKRAVLQALASGAYDLVHYAGHAQFDPKAPQTAGLILADNELLSTEEIERHLAGRPVVFLNACRSAALGTLNDTEGPLFLGQAAQGISSAFIQGGALAAIGTLWPVHDANTSALALSFYRTALSGVRIAEALRLARQDAKAESTHTGSWAALTQYGSPQLTLAIAPQVRGWPATVLAAHLRGIETLFATTEPQKAAELVLQCLSDLAEEIAVHGGQVVSQTQDLVVATFGVPVTREEDAEQGVCAALALHDRFHRQDSAPQMSLGVGLSSGIVFSLPTPATEPSGITTLGPVVSEAMALARRAAHAQTLLTGATERLARRRFVATPVDLADLAAPTPVLVYQAVGPRSASESMTHGVSFVGRANELQSLLDMWRQCQRGHGQIIGLAGEAGIGKSRLLQEFRRLLDGQNVTWLEAASPSAYRPAPFRLLASLLRTALDISPTASVQAIQMQLRTALQRLYSADFAPRVALDNLAILGDLLDVPFADISLEHLDLAKRQTRLQDVLAILLAQAISQKPLVLVLEDVHWADYGSLEILNRLVGGIGSQPVMVLASYRSEDGWQPPWGNKRNHRTLFLADLDPVESRLMLAEQLRLAEVPETIAQTVMSRTGGNPFFLRQVAASLQESGLPTLDGRDRRLSDPVETVEIPATVQRVILARVHRLAEAARQLLPILVVAGDQVERSVLEAATSGTRDEAVLDQGLAQLTDREFLSHALGQDRYHFAHALYQTAIYDSLLGEDRRRIHCRLGEAMERVYAGRSSEVLDLLAQHFYASVVETGKPDKVVAHTDSRDLARAAEYLVRAGSRAYQRFSPREAIAHFRRALLIGSHLGDIGTPQLAASYEGLGDACTLLGDFDDAFSHYLAALGLVADEASHVADLCWKIAVSFERQARYEQAAEWLDHGLQALTAQRDNAVFSKIAVYYGMIRIRQGQSDEGLAWAEKSMVHETAQAHNIMAVVLRAQGQLELAEQHCRRSIELAEQAGDLLVLAKATTNLGVVLFELGHWQEALLVGERARQSQADIGDAYMHAITTCNLSDIHRHLGNLDTAIELARQGLQAHETIHSEFGQALAHLNWGLALLAMDRPQQARAEHLEVARRLMEDNDIQDLHAQVLWSIAECLLYEGQLEEAQTAAEQASEVAKTQKSLSDQGVAQRVLGSIRDAQGERLEAEALIEFSLQILNEHGPTYQLGRTYLALAIFYAADAQRHSAARQALQQARSIFQALEADLELSMVDAVTARLSDLE
jgi:predicted ATPase/CHAT domain-containing protein